MVNSTLLAIDKYLNLLYNGSITTTGNGAITMKIAIITDLHWGARKDDPFIQRKQLRWIQEQFFPTLEQYDVEVVFNLGDTFDNRLSVNVNTFSTFYNHFFYPLSKKVKHVYSVIGNHDSYYKTHNESNVLRVIAKSLPNHTVIQDSPLEVMDEFILVPWVCPRNQEEILHYLQLNQNPNTTVLGHFQIAGIPLIGGVCKHGLDQALFAGYKRVISGHFHNPSITNNIWYIGNPFFFNWGDIDQEKGFYIYDTETQEYTHIPTTDKVYHIYDFEDLPEGILEAHREQQIRIRCNTIGNHKEELTELLRALSAKENRVEVIETAVASDELELQVDTSKQDIQSREFLNEVITELNLDNKDEIKSYMGSLLDKALGRM